MRVYINFMVVWINEGGEGRNILIDTAFSFRRIAIVQIVLDLVVQRRSHAD